MDNGTWQGIGTLLALLAFLGVCWWAFSKHKKKDFEEAAQLPFAEDEDENKDDTQSREGKK